MLTWLIIALLAAALFLFTKHRRNRMLGGLPTGDLIAADNEDQECPVLVSRRYGLKGRSDALVRTDAGAIIPVERKRTNAPSRAIAYGILVEDQYGQPPPCVRIQYADRWFDEPYTEARKQWVMKVSQRLRAARRLADCGRSHGVTAKCKGCGRGSNAKRRSRV